MGSWDSKASWFTSIRGCFEEDEDDEDDDDEDEEDDDDEDDDDEDDDDDDDALRFPSNDGASPSQSMSLPPLMRASSSAVILSMYQHT